MDASTVHKIFEYSDSTDIASLRGHFHENFKLSTVNLGLDAAMGKDEYLQFIEKQKGVNDAQGVTIEHLPDQIAFGPDLVVIRGRILRKSPADGEQTFPYVDFWKLQDDQIVDYLIGFNL